MTTNSGSSDDKEIRCFQCDFLVGFSRVEKVEIVCIYCQSECTFFRNEFGPRERTYVFETVETDKSAWRRGLMHDRKNAIRTWHEVIEDEKNEPGIS